MSTVNRDYYAGGQLKDEFFYCNGNPVLHKHYHENGVISHEIPSLGINRIHGVVKHYYESGQMAREVPFEHGLKNGREQFYWENGKLRHTVEWKNGKEHGTRNKYNENGRLILHTSYKDGEERILFKTLSNDVCDLVKKIKDKLSRKRPTNQI